jgi:hypothetical protein
MFRQSWVRCSEIGAAVGSRPAEEHNHYVASNEVLNTKWASEFHKNHSLSLDQLHSIIIRAINRRQSANGKKTNWTVRGSFLGGTLSRVWSSFCTEARLRKHECYLREPFTFMAECFTTDINLPLPHSFACVICCIILKNIQSKINPAAYFAPAASPLYTACQFMRLSSRNKKWLFYIGSIFDVDKREAACFLGGTIEWLE